MGILHRGAAVSIKVECFLPLERDALLGRGTNQRVPNRPHAHKLSSSTLESLTRLRGMFLDHHVGASYRLLDDIVDGKPNPSAPAPGEPATREPDVLVGEVVRVLVFLFQPDRLYGGENNLLWEPLLRPNDVNHLIGTAKLRARPATLNGRVCLGAIRALGV